MASQFGPASWFFADEERKRRREKEEEDQWVAIVTAQACPAKMSTGSSRRICGRPPAEGSAIPFPYLPPSLHAFCELHLIHLINWTNNVGAVTENQRAEIIREYEEEKAAKLEAESVVYFLSIPGDRIKIGTTMHLDRRIATHRRTYGGGELLLTIPGRDETERQTHARFRKHRVNGQREVFHAVPELLTWITKQVAKQGARVA